MTSSILLTACSFYLLFSAVSQKATAGSCSAVSSCLQQNQTCGILPLPNTTESRPFQAANFSLTEIRKGVYAFGDGLYVSLIIFDNDHLVVVDCPHNFLERLPNGVLKLSAAINQVLNGRVPRRMDVVYSHADADHFGNAGEVVNNVTTQFVDTSVVIWGTEETRQRLRSKDAERIPKVQRIISEHPRTLRVSCSLWLDLTMVQGHSLGDVIVHIPKSKEQPSIAYLVDYIWPGFAPLEHFGFPADFGAYIRTLHRLKNLGAQILIPGHWTVGSNADVISTLEYSEDTLKFVEEAADEITPQMEAASNIASYFIPGRLQYGNTAFFFKQFSDLQASICARKLIAKYGCDLGAVALNSVTHCRVALFWSLTNTI